MATYTFEKVIDIAGSGITYNNKVIEELELEITFGIWGKDIPATWEHPAEYAEVEIQTITAKINEEVLSSELTETILKELKHCTPKLDSILETYCWEYLDTLNEDD